MDLEKYIRVIDGFPKDGVFKDVTTLVKDGCAFKHAVKSIADVVRSMDIDIIVGPEARGFYFELRVLLSWAWICSCKKTWKTSWRNS